MIVQLNLPIVINDKNKKYLTIFNKIEKNLCNDLKAVVFE